MPRAAERPTRKPVKLPGSMTMPYPDLRHYTLRDYGNRVGAFRLLDRFADAGNDPSLLNIRRAMERKLSADYADAVTAKDVNVVKNGNTITAQVAWQKVLPMVANVSILIDFDASASR